LGDTEGGSDDSRLLPIPYIIIKSISEMILITLPYHTHVGNSPSQKKYLPLRVQPLHI
jgi:hypothetical protein